MQKPQFLPESDPITFEGIIEEITKIKLDPLAIAVSVLDVARKYIPSGEIGHPDAAFHVWGAGAVALAALTLPCAPLEGDTIRRIDFNIVASLLKKVAGLTSQERINCSDPSQLQLETSLGILRVAMQGSLQGDDVPEIYRTLYLLELLDTDLQTVLATSPFDELFRARYGCSTLEYMFLVFGFHSMSAEHNFVELATFWNASKRKAELSSICRMILEAQGCQQVVVSNIVSQRYARFRAEGLIQAFFTQKPFIQLTGERWLLPLPPFTRFTALNGALFAALDLAREEAAAEGISNPALNQRSTQMGRRFETLVHSTLKTIYGDSSIIEEFEYEKKSQDKSADFMVYEQTGELTLIQAKLKRLSPGAFFGFDYAAFENDAKGAIAESIWKTIRFLFRLSLARKTKRLLPGLEKRADRILAAPRFFLLGVVPAMPAVFRFASFRSALEEGVEAKLTPEEWNWWRKKSTQCVGWHVIDWEELSSFAALAYGNDSLFNQLSSYFAAFTKKPYSESEGFFPSFRDWYLRRNPTRERRHLAPHYNAFSLFVNQARSFISFHTADPGSPATT